MAKRRGAMARTTGAGADAIPASAEAGGGTARTGATAAGALAASPDRPAADPQASPPDTLAVTREPTRAEAQADASRVAAAAAPHATDGIDPDSAAALGLAAAVAARLCHDLGGPLGGLAGALEVAAEDAAARGEALEIATEGAAALARRLRLLRAAWAGCGPTDAAELARLAEGLPPRVRTDLSGLGQAPLPAATARLALNLLLLGAEALPRGGTLHLSRDPAGLQARLEGPGAGWPADSSAAAWRDVSPRELQRPLTRLAAAAAGMRLVRSRSGLVLQCVGRGLPL